jgi:hypothetical protein
MAGRPSLVDSRTQEIGTNPMMPLHILVNIGSSTSCCSRIGVHEEAGNGAPRGG